MQPLKGNGLNMKSDSKNFYIELSEQAYDDLVNIQNYTYARFGASQQKRYAAFLEEAFSFLQMHPFGGHRRDDIPKDYQAWPVQEHIIIYRVEKDILYIVRVLHERMNFRYKF